LRIKHIYGPRDSELNNLDTAVYARQHNTKDKHPEKFELDTLESVQCNPLHSLHCASVWSADF